MEGLHQYAGGCVTGHNGIGPGEAHAPRWGVLAGQSPNRSSTRFTCDACHCPPRAVGTLAAFNASAICRRLAPCCRMGRIMDATFSARARALAFTAAFRRFDLLQQLPSPAKSASAVVGLPQSGGGCPEEKFKELAPTC